MSKPYKWQRVSKLGAQILLAFEVPSFAYHCDTIMGGSASRQKALDRLVAQGLVATYGRAYTCDLCCILTSQGAALWGRLRTLDEQAGKDGGSDARAA